jgi:hypothetical protein
MKILHTAMLNTREFNKLTEKIIESLYQLNPGMRELYDIHINYIDDSWQIDFIPKMNNIPVIKVNTYIKQDDNGHEVLKLTPRALTDMPTKFNFSDKRAYDLCMNYVELFDFVLSLHDFEYRLN